jgi:hypothetical protein
MLEEAPVFYSEKWGWWALSRWDDVRAAALDPGTFPAASPRVLSSIPCGRWRRR